MKNKSGFGQILESVLEKIERESYSEDIAVELVRHFLKTGPADLLEAFKQEAPILIDQDRIDTNAFEVRLYHRWKKPLELLKLLWSICRELCEDHAHEGPHNSDKVVFDTLAHLQPRALLIGSEILCLLKGGFADGALARWRSLHELVVVSMFLAKHGHQTALAYRLSVWFTNLRRANNYNEYAASLNLELIDDEEMSSIVAMKEVAEEQLGRALKGDWDWASGAIGKKDPNFYDLEKDIQMDHWRPYFKWACQHIHAGFVRPEKLLGMTEAEEFFFQIGPSNSGLVNPIHMTAIALMQMCTNFLSFPEPDFDRAFYMKVLQLIVDEIGVVAVEVQKQTLEEARRSQHPVS